MKNIIKGLGIILVLLVLALLLIPVLFKGKIVGLIKEQANKQVQATISFNDDISLGLISSFPNLSLGVKDISVVGKNEFEGDTLFAAKEFTANLDLMSIIQGEPIGVRKIFLDEARVHAIVLPGGKANWDISLPDSSASKTTDTSATAFHIKLKKLELKNAHIIYDDQDGKIFSELSGMDYVLEGDFTEKLFVLKNKLSIQELTAGMDGISYLSKVKATADADIDANMNEFSFVFKDNTCTLNALEIGFNGMFQMKEDDMIMDIKYGVKKNELKQFLSLVPAIYSGSFADLQSKGNLSLSGFVKGIFNDKQMPAFGLNIGIQDGWFKYPALPAPVENMQMDLAISNPDGEPDHTLIQLNKMHIEIEKDPFDARLVVKTPISDPDLDAALKGRLNLGNVLKIVPLEGMKLAGIIDADMEAKGKLSAIEKQAFNEFYAGGSIRANSVHVETKDLPAPFDMSNAGLEFSPSIVKLSAFDATLGKSDFHMNGELQNFFAYYLGKGILKGKLNFKSQLLDANQFLSSDTTESNSKEDTSAMAVVEIPSNIDFTLNSSIKQLLYTNMEISNFKGTVMVAESKLNFKQVVLNTLGSTMKMDGYYETSNPKKPTVEMDFSIADLDIQKAFKTFNTVQKLAPAAENISGLFSTNLHFSSPLTQHMQPVLQAVTANGLLSIPSAKLSSNKSLQQLADLLKKPEYKEFSLDRAKIIYEVKDGRVYTKDFDVKVGNKKMVMKGSTGLDQTIEYTGNINVPRKDLGAANSAMEAALSSLNAQGGTNIKLNEELPVQVKFGGTFLAPTISTNIGELAKQQASSLGAQVKDELLNKKKELEAKAKAEAEKKLNDAKAEAERLKNETEAKLKAEKERLKKEAEEKAKAESEKLKNKAKEEAKKKLKGLF
ncbi:MAG: AsmA-like C-terminal region-containing protein [Bacteroidia bacterium]